MRKVEGNPALPVVELLLAAVRAHEDPPSAQRLAALCSEGPDWDAVIGEAFRQGVFPHVYRSLLAEGPGAVPPGVRELLHAHARSIATNNLLLASELATTIDTLAAGGIESLPLKGPVLCQRMYGDLVRREFYDIDVLVSGNDVRPACAILAENGYHRDDERAELGDGPLPNDLHIEMRRKGLGFMVEVHWALSTREDPLPMDFDYLWSRRQAAEFLGQTISVLHPADELFFLCAHGTRHGWNHLKWICDVADFVRASPVIDWGELLRWTRSHGVERILLVGCLLASDILGLALPSEVLERCRRDGTANALAAQASARLFVSQPEGGAGLAALHLFRIRARNRLRDRLHYIGALIQPHETERILMPLPGRLRVIHFLARPLRIMLRLLPWRPVARRVR